MLVEIGCITMPYCHSFFEKSSHQLLMKRQAALISKSRCTNVDSADVDLKATDAACLLDLFVYLS